VRPAFSLCGNRRACRRAVIFLPAAAAAGAEGRRFKSDPRNQLSYGKAGRTARLFLAPTCPAVILATPGSGCHSFAAPTLSGQGPKVVGSNPTPATMGAWRQILEAPFLLSVAIYG